MPIWWTVAVVEPAKGEVDRIVGEELHVDSDALCLEDESEASKLKNMQFSRNLREEGATRDVSCLIVAIVYLLWLLYTETCSLSCSE